MRMKHFAGAVWSVNSIVKFRRSPFNDRAPVGLILYSEHDAAVAHYSLGNLGNQVLAREVQPALLTEEQLIKRREARRRQFNH